MEKGQPSRKKRKVEPGSAVGGDNPLIQPEPKPERVVQQDEKEGSPKKRKVAA